MFDRIKSLFGAMVNKGVGSMETPELLLEQAEMELQTNVKKLREALTDSVASEKLIEKQLQKNTEEASTWEKRAGVAVQAGNDSVAKECLQKKQQADQTVQSLKTQLEQQKTTSVTLKDRYAEMDEKLKQFLRKKPEMKARSEAGDALAKANELISNTGGSSMDKWEEKIREKEIKSDPLGTAADEQKFKALDKHSELDDELAALKAKMGSVTLIVDKSKEEESKAIAQEVIPLITELHKPKDESAGESK